jgi:protein-tyrosine phosphatase
VIDLHCHLLPGIDDGPADLGGTLAMAQQHVKAGIEVVAATPHVAWDMPNDAATIELHLADTRAALAAARIPLEVVRGAEIDVHQAVRLGDR